MNILHKILTGVVTLLMLCCFANAGAQQYRGAALYQASGPVKKIKYKTESRLMYPRTISFTKNGRINKSHTVYDEKTGLPMVDDMQLNVKKPSYYTKQYNFNEKGEPLKIINDYCSDKEPLNLISEYQYSDGQNISLSVLRNGENYIDCQYSDYKYDEQGNWISRKVVQTVYSQSQGEERSEYTETRKITYYR